MLLKDKVAVITGGAGINGLGFATARLMAAQAPAWPSSTWNGPSRPPPRAAGRGHLGLVADVTDKASCEAAAAAVLKRLRPHRRAGQQRGHHAGRWARWRSAGPTTTASST
jgi:NAD(P)-dependent dehydrogenase (short-subunit alcohol dehydrogenase family)